MKVNNIYVNNEDCIKHKEEDRESCDLIVEDVIYAKDVLVNVPGKGDDGDLLVTETLWCKDIIYVEDDADIRKYIERSVKNTVGYHEAKDKESFMVGVSVAVTKTRGFFEDRLATLERRIARHEEKEEEVKHAINSFEKLREKYYE